MQGELQHVTHTHQSDATDKMTAFSKDAKIKLDLNTNKFLLLKILLIHVTCC